MSPILPPHNNPFRWLLLAGLVLLVGFGLYLAWPAPVRREYADGSPVILSRSQQRQLTGEAARLDTSAQRRQRQAARLDSQAQYAAGNGRRARQAAIHLQQATKITHASTRLSASSTADSVRQLTDFFTNY